MLHSHINFCNALFKDIHAFLFNKLQKVQNQAGRVVTNAPYDHPTTDILKPLHWMPVMAIIMYRILVIMFRILAGDVSSNPSSANIFSDV